jgi:hypothetical protein
MAIENISNDFAVTLTDIAKEERNFTSIESLRAFIAKESRYWQEEGQKHSNNAIINNIAGNFATLHHMLEAYIESSPKLEDVHKTDVLNNLISIMTSDINKSLFSGTPPAQAIVDIASIGNDQTNAFWNYLQPSNTTIAGGHTHLTKTFLEGYLRAYEFFRQGEGELNRRRDSEKRAISAMRKELAEKNDELITEVGKFQASITEWKNTSQKELAEDRTSYKAEQEKFLTESAQALAKSLEDDGHKRDEFFADAAKKREELEALYTNVLRFKPATQYWETRATTLHATGMKWGRWLFGVTVASCLLFSGLFWILFSSDITLPKFSVQHWQAIVLLVAILSLVAFAVRSFAKLTFSSFHLARDAEERKELTYVYLALSHDAMVDTETRKIVLQSLFSRADTGLLAGEHGPTMPAAEVLKNIK